MSIRTQIMSILLVVTLITAGLYTLLLYTRTSAAIMQGIDQKLLTSAAMVAQTLPPGYHDRIESKESVSTEQHLDILHQYNRLCLELDLQYLWSVLLMGNQVYFTTSTSTSKDPHRGDYARFFDKHSDPQAFAETRAAMAPTYSTFTNEWGRGRMILVPKLDRHGRIYMLGASLSLDTLDKSLQELLQKSFIIWAGVMFMMVLVALFAANWISRPLRQLSDLAERVVAGSQSTKLEVSGPREVISLSQSMEKVHQDLLEQLSHYQTYQQLSYAIDTSPIATAILSKDGHLLYANARFRASAGGQDRIKSGSHIRDFQLGFPEDVDHSWRKHTELGQPWAAEVEVSTFSDELGYERVTITPFRSGKQAETSILFTLQNITRRKRLERNLRHEINFQRVLLNTLPIPVFFKDTEGVFLGCNAAFCKLLALPEWEIVGRSIFQLIPKEMATRYHDKDMQLLKEGGLQDYEGQIRNGEGQERLLHFFKAPFHNADGSLAGLVAAMVDITDRVLFESKIMQMNAELESRVQKRTRDLEQSMDNVQSLQRQLVETETMATLGTMVAGVAHEVNSPLGVGVMASSELQEEVALFRKLYEAEGISEEEFDGFIQRNEELLKLTVTNLKRAGELLQNFKRVAVDQSDEAQHIFKLDEQIEAVVQSLSYLFKKRAIQMEVNCRQGLEIKSLPGAVSQIVTNLISNAIKHGFQEGDSGIITLTVTDQDHQITLDFADNGQGMDQQTQDKIFERYFTTQRDSGGSGLGMHIVHSLVVQKLQGTIYCESEPGIGTRFCVSFPVA
ncbi:PAS domain-containing protein [Magnetococcus sp. PR-3]|uniref:PAS domain-containing protein n=1 Tax=Magnetococcus sp. PR-3 TaxID=3120355 RepID=UPI002FCE465B